MIDDIVELPRPLKKFSLGTLSSYIPYEAPTSAFGIQLGICVDIEDLPICIGNEFSLLAGKDAPYRYKLVEHTPDSICEYVALSDEPITSPNANIFTLWLNQTNKETLQTEKYYFWDVIAACRKHYGFQDCMRLDEEVRDLMLMLNPTMFPGLKRAHLSNANKFYPIRNETDEIDNMHMLRANIIAMQDALMGEYMFDPNDVFRGINFETRENGIKLYSGAGKILSKNVVAPKDLKWLKSPDFNTKPYHMCLRSTRPPLSDANVHALVEYTRWFDVLKYVELIPYSELFVEACDKTINVIRVYNPYDHISYKDLRLDHLEDPDLSRFTNLFEELNYILPPFKKMTLYRSWGEEVYITLQQPNCKTKQYYFDLMYAALGSRMFSPTET